MEQYISKSALVAEIEKRYETNIIGAHSAFRNGKIEALREVKTLINTHEVKEVNEEPTSNDLEEAAHLYVDTTIEYFDSEGNPCCYSAFKAGAQWQKEQMITKACVFLKSTDFYKYYNREFIKEFKKAMEE